MDLEEKEDLKRQVQLDLQMALSHLPGLSESMAQSCIGVPHIFQSCGGGGEGFVPNVCQSGGDEWVLVVEYMQPMSGFAGVSPEEMVNEINRQMQDTSSVLRRQMQTGSALSHVAHRYYYRTMPRAMHARMSTAFRSWRTRACAARERVRGAGFRWFSLDAMDFLQKTLQQQSSDQLRIAVETRLFAQQAVSRLDCLVANSPSRGAPMWAEGDIVDHKRRSQHSTPLAQVVRVPDDDAYDVWEGKGRGGGDRVGVEVGGRERDEVRLAVPKIEFSSRRKTRTSPEEEADLSSGDESRESNQDASDTPPPPRLSLSLNLSNITETNLESREPTPVSKGGETVAEKGGESPAAHSDAQLQRDRIRGRGREGGRGGVGEGSKEARDAVAAAEDGEEEGAGEEEEEEEDALLPQTVFSRHAF